ncbi:MAG: glycosyltransferase family 4 protein [Desulfovibrionaceae bacterium]|nr:glycosyltransferase family 4 protein [Desulfovibrionaceae bacterium]
MKLLFIHQNFPGQYLRLVRFLKEQGGHDIYGLGDAENIRKRGTLPGITTIGYATPGAPGERTHHYLKSTEAAVRRGQSVARSLLNLKRKGVTPDVISVHPGWGEALFIRDVYPDTPILAYCEYFFRAGQADMAFDPEFPHSVDRAFGARIRNTPQILALMEASACISPTEWQASRYPATIRTAIRVIHDGLDTDFMCPDPEEEVRVQPMRAHGESRIVGKHSRVAIPRATTGKTADAAGHAPPDPVLRLSGKDKIITYAARNLEPYRGFHIFMRSLPEIQKLHPDAQTLIVGNDGISYSDKLPEGQSYKSKYLQELQGDLDLSRIHFLGSVSYAALRALFRISSVHVYLTYPFVLSWSVLEAMACEALLVASATEPVREVVTDGENGLLVDFFDQKALAARVDAALREPEQFTRLRQNARRTVVRRFSLPACLQRQVALLEELKLNNCRHCSS